MSSSPSHGGGIWLAAASAHWSPGDSTLSGLRRLVHKSGGLKLMGL